MKPYFNFNRKEKLGVVVLGTLMLMLTVGLNIGYSTYVPNPFEIDKSAIEFLSTGNESQFITQNQEANQEPVQKEEKEYRITDFDPNKLNLKGWESLGFSKKQAQSIVNYKNNYGPFKKKEDIQRLYVVSDEKYAELKPFIKIESQPGIEEPVVYSDLENKAEIQFQTVELNAATKEDLIKLPGIGDYYASRILNYRDKIGGFLEMSQVEEMSISDDAKAILKEQGEINPDLIKTININTAPKDEIRKIPFSNWLTTAAILKAREKKSLTNLDFLTPTEISDSDKQKFAAYIHF